MKHSPAQFARRFVTRLVVFVVVVMSSLWATSLALEPDGIGEALAPDPVEFTDAVIQVYGADVWGFRGNFAIHTWLAVKPENAENYDIFQVIGWRLRRGRPVVSVDNGNPAKPWFGSPAILLHERRGADAQALITRIQKAVRDYPFADTYTMWPGPNSNSFTAWIGLEVPELELVLPLKAIGQGWMQRNYAGIKHEGPASVL
jgi:hypothetical protein